MRELVLLHGWGFDSRVWGPLAAGLAGSCKVHDAHLPGYGRPVLAADDLPAGATICAWSLGAFQAMAWAARRPDRVARLVLVGATPRFLQATGWPHAQPPELLAGFAAGVAADPAKTLRRFAALVNRGDRSARVATRAMTTLLEDRMAPPAVLAAGLDQLRDVDLRGLVPAIAQPTLLLHGEKDPLMPVAAARWLADHLPRGRLEVFAEAAHAPFLSQAERFAGLVDQFLHDA